MILHRVDKFRLFNALVTDSGKNKSGKSVERSRAEYQNAKRRLVRAALRPNPV